MLFCWIKNVKVYELTFFVTTVNPIVINICCSFDLQVERCQEGMGREEKIKVGNEEQKIKIKQEKDRKL